MISDFRNRRFDTADCAPLTDLEALSQLQHLGAATSLVDFSHNPLAALWFACQDEPRDPNDPATSQQDGAVFKVDSTYGLDSDPGRLDGETGPHFEEILHQRLISPHDLLAWSPPAIASARERVVAQHSVLLLGRPLMESNPSDSRITKIPVPYADKERLRGELAAIGIDASSLFPDLHGFASTHGVDHPALQQSAKDLLAQGISDYHRRDAAGAHHNLALYITKQPGDWTARLLLSNACVDLRKYGEALSVLDAAEQHIESLPSSQHYMLYANRANTRAAMEDHEGAVGDYNRAHGLTSGNDMWGVLFNRGNSYFALREFQKARADFEACDGLASAAYNAGNACIALGQLGDAAEKYTGAQEEAKVRESSIRNLKAVRGIMSLIGTNQCDNEMQLLPFPNVPSLLRFVIRTDRQIGGPRIFPVVGNAGNQGNFGWGVVGGSGFSGQIGMIVEVKSSSVG